MLPYAYNWAAADKYNKAAAVDPSVAADANEKVNCVFLPVKISS